MVADTRGGINIVPENIYSKVPAAGSEEVDGAPGFNGEMEWIVQRKRKGEIQSLGIQS